MDLLTDQQLIDAIDAFLDRSGMKPSRFGREVANEPGFLERLRSGRSVTLKTANRIAEFIRDNDPENAPGSQLPSSDNAGAIIGAGIFGERIPLFPEEPAPHEPAPSGRAPLDRPARPGGERGPAAGTNDPAGAGPARAATAVGAGT